MGNKYLGMCLITACLLLFSYGCTVKQSDIVSHKSYDSLNVQQLVKSVKSWDESLLPQYPDGQPEITILKISIPAGTRLETHTHPVINAGFLVKGELTVYKENGETLKLKAGDPIVEVVNTLHYGLNEGDETAEIIVFYAGIEGNPITLISSDQ